MTRITAIIIVSVMMAACGSKTTIPDTVQNGWLVTPKLHSVIENASFWKPLNERNRTVNISYAFGK